MESYEDELDTEGLFSDLWTELQTCQAPSEFQQFQTQLFEVTIRTELAIQLYNQAVKSFRASKKFLEGHARSSSTVQMIQLYEAHKDELKRLRDGFRSQLDMLRLLGDTLAWNFIPANVIRAVHRQTQPGYLSGKEGTLVELEVLEALKSEGFILMHDLTTAVRVGDLSIHGPSDFNGVIIEVKKGRRKIQTPQELRQAHRLKTLGDYWERGWCEMDEGQILASILSGIVPRYEWEAITKCLQEAKSNGIAACESSDKLALYLGVRSQQLRATDFKEELARTLKDIGWEDRNFTQPVDILMGRKRAPFLMPLTRTTIPQNLVTDLLFQRLTLCVALDWLGIHRKLMEISAEFGNNSSPETEHQQQWYVADGDGYRMEITEGQYQRILYEGLSPSSFLEICRDAFVKSRERKDELRQLSQRQ